MLKRESFEAVVGDWPLTVSQAEIVCGSKNRQSLGVRVSGRTYALNGTGETFEGWSDLMPIWADNPTYAGLKVDEGDLLDYVRGYCARQ